ncbi:cytochrome P450 2J2-like [Sphaerodactylus townsendi]|uniref:cytochrome P450 2J2-like n=1 Tax=Sphaerodactylus townsendi TaxID=933632 RepID=UPI002026D4CA|nr:cytochrome P450 2J2-like [Sphaerodactylus townsendi]
MYERASRKMLGVLVCLLILFFVMLFRSKKSYPPGPFRLPILGGTWRFWFNMSRDNLLQMEKEYGNVFTMWVGPIPMIMLSGFQSVKEGLVNHSEAFADRLVTPLVKALTKEKGIMFSNGHTWKEQRKFGIVTMRKLGLGKKGVEHQIQEEAQQLIETFARAKREPLDPSLHIRKAVSNVICALAFGYRFSVDDEEFLKLTKAFHVILTYITSPWHGFYEMAPRLFNYLPGPHQKVFSSRAVVDSFIRKEIQKHKAQGSLHDPQDYIDFYLLQMRKAKSDPNSTYDEENLAQSIFDLFIAGSDTTFSTLQWALLLMANHPDVQEKVYKEMEDVLGSSPLCTHQDVKKLPYTNAVIHEILRSQYILIIGIPRQSVKDENILGFPIPKGTIVVPDIASVLLDPKQWATPQEFNPNHFLDKGGNFVTREAFLPFGAGARICLGKQLAEIELFIFFTSLLRSFTFQPPEGVKEINTEPSIGLTVHPHPYKVCAVPRSNAY